MWLNRHKTGISLNVKQTKGWEKEKGLAHSQRYLGMRDDSLTERLSCALRRCLSIKNKRWVCVGGGNSKGVSMLPQKRY